MPNFYTQKQFLDYERTTVTAYDIMQKVKHAVNLYNEIEEIKNADIFKDFNLALESIKDLERQLPRVESAIESAENSINYFTFIKEKPKSYFLDIIEKYEIYIGHNTNHGFSSQKEIDEQVEIINRHQDYLKEKNKGSKYINGCIATYTKQQKVAESQKQEIEVKIKALNARMEEIKAEFPEKKVAEHKESLETQESLYSGRPRYGYSAISMLTVNMVGYCEKFSKNPDDYVITIFKEFLNKNIPNFKLDENTNCIDYANDQRIIKSFVESFARKEIEFDEQKIYDAVKEQYVDDEQNTNY